MVELKASYFQRRNIPSPRHGPLGLGIPSEGGTGVGARRVQVPFEEVLGSLGMV